MHDEIATMIAAMKVLISNFQRDLAALESLHAAAGAVTALDSGDNTPPPPHP